jgi:hypothetical protein
LIWRSETKLKPPPQEAAEHNGAVDALVREKPVSTRPSGKGSHPMFGKLFGKKKQKFLWAMM